MKNSEASLVLDIAKLVKRGTVSESHHIDCVMLEPWQARELLAELQSWRDRAPVTSQRFIDTLRDALSEAL